MAGAKIRRNRPRDESVVRIAARLRASSAQELVNAAHDSGLSIGLYLELLTQHIRHQEGALPVLAPTLEYNEELPISA